MLKPEQIKIEEFELSVIGGYKREQVDAFLDKVHADYDKLYNENVELIEKLKICVSKIEEYQKDEKFLKTAIINAEKLNETSLRDIEFKEKQIIQSANDRASVIVETARAEAEDVVKTAKAEAEDIVKTAQIKSAESIKICEKETAEKIAELKALIAIEEENLVAMKKEVSDFKDSVLKIYKAHLDIFSKLPEYSSNDGNSGASVKVADVPYDNASVEYTADDSNADDVVADTITNDVSNVSILTDVEKKNAVSEQTAEFVLDAKNKTETSDDSEEMFERNFKFKGLKFGTDFDVNKD